MKKFFKTIFGRFAFIAIAVILQIIVIDLLIEYVENYFFAAQVVMYILSAFAIVSLSFRFMPSEGKITWVVIVLTLPVFGTILYFLFSKNIVSFRQKRMHDRLDKRNDDYNLKNSQYSEDMIKVAGLKYFGQMEYIYSCNQQRGFLHTKTTYYSDGYSFWQDLIKDLQKAKKFIFLEYFIMDKGVMFDRILEILKEKAKEGLDVRMIYDDIGSIQTLPNNFPKKLAKYGIKCVRFNKFIPVVSAVHNNRDHRKIAVIDGKVGFTGGINLADEYINHIHPYGYWKDTAIRIEGHAVDELTLMFITSYQLQTRKIDKIDQFLNQFDYHEKNGIVLPYADGPRPAYLEYVAENVYLNMINQAEKYVWITTPYLIVDGKLKTALKNAAMRGVDVRIIMPHIPDKRLIFAISRSNYRNLQNSGVKIFEFTPGFIHAKQFLVDDEVGTIGTINMDYRSLIHHYENAIWMYKTTALVDMKKDFEDIFTKSMNMDDFKQNWFIHFLCKVGEVFQPLL